MDSGYGVARMSRLYDESELKWPRRLVVATGMANAVLGGILYCFGLLSNDLRELGGYSQLQINIVGSIVYTVGLGAQLPLSMVVRVRPMREVTIWAAVITVLGWVALVLSCHFPSIGLLGAAWGLIGLGCCCSSMPALNIMNSYFTHSEASMRRVSTAYLVIYGIMLVCIAPVWGLLELGGTAASRLQYFSYASTAWAVFTLVLIIAFLRPAPTDDEDVGGAGAASGDAKSALIEKTGNIQRYDDVDDANGEEAPLFAKPGYKSFGQATAFFLRTPTFWLMSICLLASFAVAITQYNTAGAVAATVGATDTDIAILFIIFGVVQTGGRMLYSFLYGTISARTSHRFAMTFLIGINAAALAGANLSAYFVNSPLLMNFYLGIHALVYGALWYLLVEIGQEKVLFGKAAADTPTLLLYGLFAYSPAIGPLVFDSVSGAIYDGVAEEQGCLGNPLPPPGSGSASGSGLGLFNSEECLCLGEECSSEYHLICAGVMAAVAVLSTVSYFTSSRHFRYV